MSVVENEPPTGFAAMGQPVPKPRKERAVQDLGDIAPEISYNEAQEVIEKAANFVEGDAPDQVLRVLREYVDFTGAYRLMACLCASKIEDNSVRARGGRNPLAREMVRDTIQEIDRPQTINGVKEEAGVDWHTAKKHLESMAEEGEIYKYLINDKMTLYWREPEIHVDHFSRPTEEMEKKSEGGDSSE